MIPNLNLLASLIQQQRGAPGQPLVQPGMQPMEQGLLDEEEQGFPDMRAEDPDFLRYQMMPLDEQQAQLQRQMQAADALMQGSGRQHTTPLGAAIGGLADVVRMGVGGYRMGGLQQKMDAIGQQRTDLIEQAGKGPSTLLRKARQQQAAPKPGKPGPYAFDDPVSLEYQDAFRAQFPNAPAELIGIVTPDNYDKIRMILQGQQGEDRRAKELGFKMNRPPKEKAPPKAPNLPSTEVTALADINVATSALDDLVSSHGTLVGGAKGVLGMIPGTDAAKYDDKMNATAQIVGKILEGGKMTDGDLPKYRRMLPDKFDSPERAAAKRDNVKKLLLQQAKQRKETFGQAGYNVKDIQVPDIDLNAPPGGGATPKAVNPLDFARTYESEKGKFGQDKSGQVWQKQPDGTWLPVKVKR